MTRGFARAAGGDRCVVVHARRCVECRRNVVEKVRRYPAACVNPPARMGGIRWIEAGFPGARSD